MFNNLLKSLISLMLVIAPLQLGAVTALPSLSTSDTAPTASYPAGDLAVPQLLSNGAAPGALTTNVFDSEAVSSGSSRIPGATKELHFELIAAGSSRILGATKELHFELVAAGKVAGRTFSSVNEAIQWGKTAFKNWDNTLSDAERIAFVEYTDKAFKNINASLRGTQTFIGDNAKFADDISAALARSNMPETVTLYRGATMDVLGEYASVSYDKLVGKRLVDKGFMSTSLVKSGQFDKELALVIKAPKGTNGAYIGKYSEFELKEVEVLLQKNQKMIVTKSEMINSQLVLTVEIIN